MKCSSSSTFETLVPCKANAPVIDLARSLLNSSARTRAISPLYIYGRAGLGKTHMLCAIANSFGAQAKLINTVDLIAEVDQAIHHHRRAALRAWLVDTKMLLLDDFHECRRSSNVQDELFAVFNHLFEKNAIVVLASDLPPLSLKEVQARLMSRACSGVVVGLHMGTLEERAEMIRFFAGDDSLSEEVVQYLAHEIHDSVRRLRAAVTQVLTMADYAGVEPDLAVARAMVPLPEDVGQSTRQGAEQYGVATEQATDALVRARFRTMMEDAKSPEEQALALEIAVGERLRQLRNTPGNSEQKKRLQRIMKAIHAGNWTEALKWMRT